MDFMASVSVFFPAASWSISRRHAFGVISSPLSFNSFRWNGNRARIKREQFEKYVDSQMNLTERIFQIMVA
jgi:hypothetical protein